MPLKHMELRARRFKIKGRQRLAVWLSSLRMPGGLCCSCLHFPKDSVWDGRRNPGHSPGSGWPGRGWQGYSSSGVPEEAEACHSSKIV